MTTTLMTWQFLDPELRFFLLPIDRKVPPVEKKWNDENCYPFFHTKLIEHLKNGGNYGLVCGINRIVVADFDDYDYYESVRKKLPYTMTVVSATKRMPHYIYRLVGDMIKKIDIKKDGKHVADIQASRCGIVCAGSSVNRRYYEVYNDLPIAEITKEQLSEIFEIKQFKAPSNKHYDAITDNLAVDKALRLLDVLGIERMAVMGFKCPYHDSQSRKSLVLFSDGSLYCFHCLHSYRTAEDFAIEYLQWKQNQKVFK